MLISEVTPGSKVTLYVWIGTNKMEFETEALEGILSPQCGLIVQPIFKNEKMLSFHVGGIVCQALAQNETDNKPYLWKEVKVNKIKRKDGMVCHVFLSKQNARPINRRSNYRVWLGFDAVAQIGINKTTYDVIVKDISATGFAFTYREDVEIKEGFPIHINFRDEAKEVVFSLTGILVRKEELEPGKILYGCRLNNDSAVIRKYVNEKQMEQSRTVGNLDQRLNTKDKK